MDDGPLAAIHFFNRLSIEGLFDTSRRQGTFNAESYALETFVFWTFSKAASPSPAQTKHAANKGNCIDILLAKSEHLCTVTRIDMCMRYFEPDFKVGGIRTMAISGLGMK